jgi:hypothetical protein
MVFQVKLGNQIAKMFEIVILNKVKDLWLMRR